MKFPLMLRSTHKKQVRQLIEDCEAEVKRVRANADGLLQRYNELEEHKNAFVSQNIELRSALRESQDQVKQLTIELHEAQKNDHRDPKTGRFVKDADAAGQTSEAEPAAPTGVDSPV